MSALILAGLLLMFGLGLFGGEKPGVTAASPTEAAPTENITPTEAVTPTETVTPTATAMPTETVTPTPGGKASTETENPPLETAVYCLNVGEGSSTLFCSGTTAVLIDGGDARTSSYVVGFLKGLGIRRLQLVVATHYDSDHISGLVGAMSAFAVDEVWGPDYEGDTKTYTSFAEMIGKRSIPWTKVKDGQRFASDGCTVTVLASSVPEPLRNGVDDGPEDGTPEGNRETGEDTSLALRVTLDNVSILVMGDSGAARERALVKKGAVEQYDIFLVNHHGSRYSNTAELLNAARPRYAVISVGTNDYGHPAKECIDRLVECGAGIFRTDLQGTVSLAVEGSTVRADRAVLTDPYEHPGGDDVQTVEHPADVSYILNGNSMVYHLPTCVNTAGVMRRNWFYFYGTAEEAEELGYRPCGTCIGKH